MAQIFPVATRAPGALMSPDKVIAVTAAGKQFLVKTVIAQADLDDPAVQFQLKVFKQIAGLIWPPDPTTYPAEASIAFRGGPNQGKGGTITVPPGWEEKGDDVAGQTLRFWLNVTGRAFDAGLDATQI